MNERRIAGANLLQDVHAGLLAMSKSFREKVCEECGWSEATFYRKAKGGNTFSNAEKDKIISVSSEVVKEVITTKDSYLR